VRREKKRSKTETERKDQFFSRKFQALPEINLFCEKKLMTRITFLQYNVINDFFAVVKKLPAPVKKAVEIKLYTEMAGGDHRGGLIASFSILLFTTLFWSAADI
jgi:hypothetical protein